MRQRGIKKKKWHHTFLRLRWTYFHAAEAVVCEETSLVRRGDSFPWQVDRIVCFTGMSEVLRFYTWSWRRKKKRGSGWDTIRPITRHRTIDMFSGSYFIQNVALKTLATLFFVKEAHFNCVWFPVFTSVLKVKVADKFLNVCKRNRKDNQIDL